MGYTIHIFDVYYYLNAFITDRMNISFSICHLL